MGHIHAENMRLYAEDAARLDEPWTNWQMKHDSNGEWADMLGHPLWSSHLEYRRKPPTVIIGGKEFFEEDVKFGLIRMTLNDTLSKELAVAFLEHFEIDIGL